VYAGRNGILGALREELIDTAQLNEGDLRALKYTPAGAFGSCRYKLKSLEQNRMEYERLIEVFKAHDIGYFFYNGGGDSQDTAWKVSQLSEAMGYPITCVGIPKTIDNDLPETDCCPGFGSVAKYVAVSIQEAGLDLASMCETSTKIFILEVMGRHAGWIAAAGALGANQAGDPPHLVLFPERALDEQAFLNKVKQTVERYGYCVIVASEGIKNSEGQFLSESGTKDAFGHAQLGGVAPVLADRIKSALGYKYHWAVSDYLQRSARHIASVVDVKQAYAVGEQAVQLALEGRNAVMATIVRKSDLPYEWVCGSVDLSCVANQERKMPENFIDQEGFGITQACRDYLLPLIEGEDYPAYQNGLPLYLKKRFHLEPPLLPAFEVKV
jgi:6-phosphofructokinase 1